VKRGKKLREKWKKPVGGEEKTCVKKGKNLSEEEKNLQEENKKPA
jgi:hypothetical protein